MSGHAGFEADLGILKDAANKDMPDVASAISGADTSVPSLLTYAPAVFGSTHGGGAMGVGYNNVVAELSAALTAFAESVTAAAGRLHAIAVNYQKIDDSLAGE